MTEKNERESARKTQLDILKSKSLKSLVVADAARDLRKHGDVGKELTHADYISVMSNPDGYLSQVLTGAFLNAENEAGEHYGGAVTPIQILQTAKGFYFGGLDKIRVNDVLELMGRSDFSDKVISGNQRQMYMEDFKGANEYAYGKLVSAYAQYVEMNGLGDAYSRGGKAIAGNLEGILTKKKDK
ncbi:hypothetical protein COU59_02895 [Candidatus Pacearchaeota archaeon CG10_big_fil_rev_8_21_14_0_10_34_12]|nr:MAG: hypothetical protein COU59_02895 [Candidatus Pacearchaeota archaeon CG10_big_fil_rev_8_21_14_0_10_34_12]